jgi:ubiquinol-cytochrome c reductase cytochrome c1 subunit
MIRKLALTAALALTALGAAHGAKAEGTIKDVAFSFEGPFGTYDRNQLQRGLQVYTEVCSACHGLEFVAFRTLGEPGGPELPKDQVRAYAASFPINDLASNPQDVDPATGDPRQLKPSDDFPANHSMGAPDLSLMAKARKGFSGPYGLLWNPLVHGIGGPEYIVSILTDFTGKTKELAGSTFYGNTTFPGGWIRMPPPLSDGQVDFADGSPNDVKHMAEDVAAFLMWTAEPKMMARKHAGFDAVFYLGLLTILLYLTNKRIWAPIKGRKKDA